MVITAEASTEVYLEALLELRDSGKRIRYVDVATHLGYSRPSVSIAIRKLMQQGYVMLDEEGSLALTQAGERLAMQAADRHIFLRDWLVSLGADALSADEDSIAIAHVISDECLDAIKRSIQEA